MIRLAQVVWTSLLAVAIVVNSAAAQVPAGGRDEADAKAQEKKSADADRPAAAASRGGPENLLAQSGLKIRDPLPEATGYDANGNEFHLTSLRGHYSVIVFGCLT